jgi:hypothetical protein
MWLISWTSEPEFLFNRPIISQNYKKFTKLRPI